jgi:hypothetical protein
MRAGKLKYRWAGNCRVITHDRLDELILSLLEESGKCEPPPFMKNRD